jgi:hypothetical protein
MCVFRVQGVVAAGLKQNEPEPGRRRRRLDVGSVVAPRAEAAHRDQSNHQNQHGYGNPLLPVELASVRCYEIDISRNLNRHNCQAGLQKGGAGRNSLSNHKQP